MPDLVVTLVEGDYFLGFGALANSLLLKGFKGKFIVGVRKEDEWLERFNTDLQRCAPVCQIEPYVVSTDWHLANYKAHLLRDLAADLKPERMTYWDPDVTLLASYGFITNWVDSGVGMVEDGCYASFPSNHPIRCAWSNALRTDGFGLQRSCERFYNSGFVGVSRAHEGFWKDWSACVDIAAKYVDLSKFKPGKREDPFFGTDQDALNMATMITEFPLSTVGPDGMSFSPGGFIMYHAAEDPKPWRKKFILSAIGGKPPSTAERAWLRHSEGPIEVISPRARRRLRAEMRVGSAIGRLLKRA